MLPIILHFPLTHRHPVGSSSHRSHDTLLHADELAGVAGLEPAHTGLRTQRLNQLGDTPIVLCYR